MLENSVLSALPWCCLLMDKKTQIFAASCIAFPDGNGVLLRGSSGAGKSEFAFRLISHYQATLVSDDQVCLTVKGNTLIASPPETIKSLLELRGIGIVKMPYMTDIPVKMIVDLTDPKQERLPDPEFELLQGISIRRIIIDPFKDLAADKLMLALTTDFL